MANLDVPTASPTATEDSCKAQVEPKLEILAGTIPSPLKPRRPKLASLFSHDSTRVAEALNDLILTNSAPDHNLDNFLIAGKSNNIADKQAANYFIFPQLNELRNADASEKMKSKIMAQHEFEVKVRKMLVNADSQFKEEVGRIWRVVGGKKTSGIIVRTNEDLTSAELVSRLTKNSIVRELDLIGERLHYMKISGDGPNFGWVSIKKGKTCLLVPRKTKKCIQQMADKGMDGAKAQ